MLAVITILFIMDSTQSAGITMNPLAVLNNSVDVLSVQAARMSRHRQMSHAQRYEAKIETLENQLLEKDQIISILNSSLIEIQGYLYQSNDNSPSCGKWEYIIGTIAITLGMQMICFAIWRIWKCKKAVRNQQNTHASNAISIASQVIELPEASQVKSKKQDETLKQMKEKLSNNLFSGEKSENAMSHHFNNRQTFLRI